MTGRDSVFCFECQGEPLLGILSEPPGERQASGVGVIVIVGGPQYRAGSHRQFTLLARALASQGHHCLRFDYRGMGDSPGKTHTFIDVEADVAAAVQSLRRHCPAVDKVVLWGLCDGASAALLYLDAAGPAAGVDGLVLLNPWVRSAETLAKTQVRHYYTQRLRQKEFWLKLLRGGTGLKALREFLGKLRTASASRQRRSGSGATLTFQDRMARAWSAFQGPVLLLLSGDDYVAKEFQDLVRASPAWSRLVQGRDTKQHLLEGVDHTFSSAAWRREVEMLTAQWMGASLAAPQRKAGP
ncbi:hydrolase 1, exosortase A system-associated [Paucibacter sp. JuS9]|uniref:hydrolase 1, exosortase A system-associated n=1 Tax=Paucibacter sp. JuS9 TaxID=3228748 RepID=UPI0037584520